MHPPSLLQRLKERKLVQWALAYLAGAFVVFQLLDALESALGLTPAIQRAILVIVGVGFFVSLVLAWYHGEKGRQRVSGPELLMVAALLLVAGVALSTLRSGDEASSPGETVAPAVEEDDRPSIAILPFDDFSPNPDDAYFADGMHDEIISKLSKITALRVISRNSVMQFREVRSPTPQVASELGVDFVVEGSARVIGTQIRIIAQLIRAFPEEHLWSNEYDQELSVENIISTQSDIAQQVAREVGAVLTGEEHARIEVVPTDDLEAYEDLMRGIYHLGRRDNPREAYQEAIRHLRAAVEQDSDLAPAHAALAWAHAQLAMWGFGDPRELWRQAEAWTESALALDETEPSAHSALAVLKVVDGWDWEEAEKELQRSIELGPHEVVSHALYAHLLMAQGRVEEGTREGRIVTALDPISPATFAHRADWIFSSRDYEAANELLEVLLARDPTNPTAGLFLMLSFRLGQRPDQVSRLSAALSADATALTLEYLAQVALLLSLASEADSARVFLDRATAGSSERYISPDFVWPTYAVLGERDEAFYWMERTVEAQSWGAIYLGVTPLADPLRDDPRYQAILDRIGLGDLKERFDSLAAADPRGGT